MKKTLLSLVILLCSNIPLSATQRPNVVFILADDLGYGDVKSFGGAKSKVPTPHFDRLCKEGMKFTNAHVTDSVCVPSRTSIMTGRYAFRFGKGEQGGPWGFIGLRFPTSQHTVGKMFRSGGYSTGYVGKWHLGTRMTTKDGKVQGPENTDFTKPIKIGPTDYGFDHCFFLPGSLDMFPYAYVRGKKWQGKVTAQKGWSAFNRVGPAAEDFLDTEVLSTFCDEAGKFIKGEAKKKKPFFLFVGLTAPHTPSSPEPGFEGKSPIGVYGDFVMNTDACIGRIREHLRKAGLDQNTLVMVSSDHGPGHYSGPERKAIAKQMEKMEQQGHFSRGPWRGYKFSGYEGGLRVPFAAVWPGGISPGTQNDALVGLVDLMATWAEIAGVKLDPSQAPDSLSFLPYLGNKEPLVRNHLLARGTRADVYYEDKWKLILGPGSGSSGPFYTEPKSEDAWKEALVEFGRKLKNHEELENHLFVQLYDLKADPGETKNLAKTHFGQVKKMIKAYSKIVDDGRTTPGPKLSNDRPLKTFRPPGFVWKK